MSNAKQTIFNDRRNNTDRRIQDRAIPERLDRRQNNRRSKYFRSQPWWLQIGYATEIMGERITSREIPVDDTFSDKSTSTEKSD